MPRLDESLLANLAPFAGIERRELRRILDQAVSKRVEAGQAVFREGEKATHFYLLLDGYIRVVHLTPEGEQVTVLHIPGGQLFGFARAVGRETYPATAIAAAECIILCWPTRLWSDFAARHQGFSAETAKSIGKHMVEMNSRIVEMATMQVQQRVARALLRLLNQTGKKTGDGIEIDFPISREDISDMTGTTLYSVSRLLSAWQKAGVLASGRKRITVLQPEKLVEFSEATVEG